MADWETGVTGRYLPQGAAMASHRQYTAGIDLPYFDVTDLRQVR
ncbi:hypothetical protein [Schaalia canis]|nr:hypothetical protein [Schaalia canis]